MKKMFMAVIALMMTISASAQFYIYCSDGNVIKVDSISMVAPGGTDTPDTPVEPEEPDTPVEPEEPTNPSAGIGVFSVSADKQVTFSKGNLQYTQSTNTWSFAENQYDYLGEANSVIDADVLADKVDCFGWSTSATNFGVSTSRNNNDYTGSFVDWGTNKIGNDAPNTWRTLSYDEWYYLRYNRTNANDLVGVAQVNGVNGLILLPDNWTCPAGVTFNSGFHSSYGVDYYAAYQTFTADQWSKLESAGAVFLPAAGYRNGSDVINVQGLGYYWSATEDYSDDAGCLYFSLDGAGMVSGSRYYGLSVRLVKDVAPSYNGHEYVDLGLSVKWATCNVGATTPEEYGDYFAWGEVEPKEVYNWSTYKWCNGSYDTQTKYCTNSDYGTVDYKPILEAADDAAHVNWGGCWRMPTDAELTELRDNCTWIWTSQNGVNGYRVTSNKEGYTNKSIFLPAAGYRYDSLLLDAGSYGSYWSSSLYTYTPHYAWGIYFYSDYVIRNSHSRFYGYSVRPVCQ